MHFDNEDTPTRIAFDSQLFDYGLASLVVVVLVVVVAATVY